MPNKIHQVGGILAVVDGEGGIEPDLIGIVAQKPRADAMEGASPAQRVGHHAGVLAHHFSRDPLDAFAHLRRGAAREGHQQDAAGIGAVDDQMGDPMGEGVGLAGAGAGNDEERRANVAASGHAVLHGPALRRIERLQISSGNRDLHESSPFETSLSHRWL